MRIEFLRMYAENTCSYASLELGFTNGFCVINGINEDDGGSNGSGKCLCNQLVTLSDGSSKWLKEVNVGDKLLCLDGNLKINETVVQETSNQEQFCYNVVLQDGREIKASGNHPFLTITGWKKLQDLKIKDRIATCRELPNFKTISQDTISIKKAELIGILLGDGSFRKNPIKVFLGEKKKLIIEKLPDLIEEFNYNLKVKVRRYKNENCYTCSFILKTRKNNPKNELTAFLESLNLMGRIGNTKEIPKCILDGSSYVIKACLKGLFGTDGSINYSPSERNKGYVDISYVSKSEKLVKQIQYLLLKFGILSRIRLRSVRNQNSTKKFSSWCLEISNIFSKIKFLNTIGMYDTNKKDYFLSILEDILKTRRSGKRDLIPGEIWEYIKNKKEEKELSWKKILPKSISLAANRYCREKKETSREIVEYIGNKLQDTFLSHLATSDIYWDEIKKIEPIGYQTTYDLKTTSVLGQDPNFVVNSIFVHNSNIPRIFFYSLTGTTPEGLKTDSVLSDFHPRNSFVQIDFIISGENYSVKRYREHSQYENKLFLFKNELDISRKNVVDTQKEIYNILGLDREHLLMLTLFSVDTISFAKSTPTERRNLFTELFPEIHKYKENYAPLFKTEKENLITELGELNNRNISFTTRINMEQEEINNAAEDLEDIIAEKGLLENSKETSQENEIEKEAIKRVNDKTAYIKSKFPEKLINNSTKITETIDKLVKQNTAKRQERNLLEVENRGRFGDKNRLEARLNRFKEDQEEIVGAINRGECSNCGTVFRTAPPKYKTKLEESTSKITECEKELTPLIKAYEKTEELINKSKEEEKETERKLSILYNFQMEMEKLAQLKEELASASAPLMEIESKLAELDRREAEIRERISKKTETRDKYIEGKTKLTKKISSIERLVGMYEYLSKISSVDIPTYLLNKYIVTLEKESSDIMHELFQGYRIVLSDTATTKKGTEKAELTLGIEKPSGTVKDYKTLSGGERQAVDISLLLGLQKLVANEKGMTSNAIFLDEILDISADNVRNESIINLLTKVSSEYDSMFLISHKSILTEEAETVLEVTKKNGISALTSIEKYD